MERIASSRKPGNKVSRLVILVAGLSIWSVVWASGWPPFAFKDSAEVYRGGVVEVLTTGATSVLDNDIDFERDRLTAVLDEDVKHGTLLLRQDGTFRYEHDGGKDGSDSFKYRAFDGTRYSRSTRVDIDIEKVPNAPPVVTGQVPDQEAVAGMSFRLRLADFFADPDDDDTLSFSARGLPKSNSLRINESTGVLSGTPRDADVKSSHYDVEIKATDRLGESAKLKFKLLISRDNRADVALAISLDANPVGVGETTRWNLQLENQGPGDLGDAQLTADWATSGPALTLTSPDACSLTGNGTSAPGLSCAIGPLAAGQVLTISVDGMQDTDGDNSLIGLVIADDRDDENNAALTSAQVVARFSEGPTQTIDISTASVDAGDLNGDGLIDVVATSSRTVIFPNNGNRAVTSPGRSLGDDTGGSSVTLLDWNGDSSLDIAVGGLAASTAEIFVNDGAGDFNGAERLRNGGIGTVKDIAAADLTSNGRSELILTGSLGTLILRRRDEGGFDQTSLSFGSGRDLAVADIDGDGDTDIIVVRASDRAVDLHYNSGDGTDFSRVTLRHGSVAAVSASDMNGDGMPDLLLAVDGDDLTVPVNKVLYQQTNGEFSIGSSFGASPVSSLLPGDVDLDGWTDVIAVNEAGVHQLYLGAPGGDLTLAAEQIVSEGMQGGILCDVNNDSSLDLIMVGRDAGVLEIHANNGIGRLGLGDRVAPELRLNGDPVITIAAGSEYIDPGAIAVDDIDGDISSQIVVTGAVDSAIVGTYSVTYSVADRASNSATVVRTVNVGVNQGTGGSGGGAASPYFVVVLLSLIASIAGMRRRQRVGQK